MICSVSVRYYVKAFSVKINVKGCRDDSAKIIEQGAVSSKSMHLTIITYITHNKNDVGMGYT